ncbi:unnamed protein product [Bathycoccus prasinos]|jgi:hypothetical protein|tara:strand:- start:31 stop:2346 length:2316 start_codon:yes stop_codon:yes gene_type:complete
MTTLKEEKRRQQQQKSSVTLWERKKSNTKLRFIEDEDTTNTSDWGRSSSLSSVSGVVANTNNENEDALEVLANSVNVIFSSTTNKSKSNKDENASYVTKTEFDFAMQAAQNALKAKTRANHMLTLQAKAAMQNAVTALKITEKECQTLRTQLADLRRDPDLATELMIEDALRRDREQLRVAKERVKKLSNAYRMLQNEIGKERYEAAAFVSGARRGEEEEGGYEGERRRREEGGGTTSSDGNKRNNRNTTLVSILPVAMEYPIKLDRAHETRTIVLAQLCMQGYALDDCERAMEELQSTDLYECLDWLEEREALRAVYNEETLMLRRDEEEEKFEEEEAEEEEEEEEAEEDRAARRRRQLAASRLIDDETTEDNDDDDDDDERSSFELGDEFDYAKYDSSNLRLTSEELYAARARAVRVLCACATDPPSRQELDEKEERRMMMNIEDNPLDLGKKEEEEEVSFESTDLDEDDSDYEEDDDDDTSEDLSTKRRAKEAKMNRRANQMLNSPIRKDKRDLAKSGKNLSSLTSEIVMKKDPEVLRKEYYIQRDKMAFSFRAIVALTKLAESASSSFFILHNGGLRAATECLRKYGETSSSCARASFALIRQFASGGGGGEENGADDFFSSVTAKHFVQTERFRILPLLVLRAVEARMEDFDVVSDGLKCLWTLIALGGDRTRKQLLKSNIAFTIRDALAVSKDDDEQYRGRRFKRVIGCGLAMCLDCTDAQELFTRLSIPGLIRAKLIEFPSIKFSGEFADLREFLASAKKKPTQ